MRLKSDGGWDKRYKGSKNSSAIKPPTWRLLICLIFWIGIPALLFQFFSSFLNRYEWVLIIFFVFLILLTPKKWIYGKEMAALDDEVQIRLKEIKDKLNQ